MIRTLTAALLLALASAASANATDDQFKKIYEREWQWRLQQSPMMATSVGVHDYDDKLGEVDEKTQRANKKYWQGVLKDLDGIDRAALAPGERVNYAIYRAQIDSNIAGVELRGYLMPLNSDSAFYSDIAFLPKSHPFATAKDYRNYIARLNDFPRWFGQETDLMRAGVKAGMTVPQVILTGRDGAIRAHADVKDPKDSVYYAPFKTIPDSIPAAEATELRAAGERAIRESIIPAYAKLLKFFNEDYVPHARKTIAVEAMPNGKAYYRQQIRDYVTLDLDPEAIHQTGLAEVARIRGEMEAIVREVKFDGDFPAFLKFLRTDPQFYAKTPEELLMNAAWIAKRVDSVLPKYFGVMPRLPFGIAPVPDAIAPFYTGGRYVPPSEGRGEPGYYWVNTYDLPSRPLYTLPSLTLHESVPGHHLQGALANEQGEQPPFRRYSYISAFGEGWALYTEHLGLEMGIYRTPYEQFGRLTYEMWRAGRLVVDTGMHHKGWTREQSVQYLRDNTAMSLHEIDTEIDRYIGWPGQALSYKLGELKIRELRARAEHALGDKFDLRAFHDTILSLGSVPLPVLEEHIDAFIAARVNVSTAQRR